MKQTISLFSAILTMSLLSAAAFAQGYQVGDKARDFKLKNVDGKAISLQGLPEAKGAIVIFTCNHCPYSQAYENRIIELHNMYEKEGYPVVAINPKTRLCSLRILMR